MEYWKSGDLTEFPTPYYGFETVDFVGGHTSFGYGEYAHWLREQGGNPAQLRPEEDRDDEPMSFCMELPEELHYNRYIADSVIDLIEESSRGDCAPFFAWCSFPDPHAPLGAPEPYSRMYDPAEVSMPVQREGEIEDLPPFYEDVLTGDLEPNGVDNTGVSEAQVREMIAATYGMISHIDTEIGRILSALAKHGMEEDTIIMFVSDHGDMMGDHGLLWKSFYTFQGCIRLPLIVASPVGAGGQTCESLVSQIDLMPTVLDLCDVDLPGAEWNEKETPFQRGEVVPLDSYPGRSWRELLRGEPVDWEDEVVIENDSPTTGFQVRTLVTDRHRLSIYPGTEHGELFDLESDPDELHNLWYKDAHKELRENLTAQLLDAYSRATPLYPIPPWNS